MSSTCYILCKKNEKNQEDAVIISINNESEFRYAYKLTSEELGAHVYIDTENGDTLKVIPFIHTAQSTYTTNTIYYGICFILYITNIFQPTLIGIALMFGIGNAFDSIVSFIAYKFLLKKEILTLS